MNGEEQAAIRDAIAEKFMIVLRADGKCRTESVVADLAYQLADDEIQRIKSGETPSRFKCDHH